jgi:hypothetical protein
MKHNPQSNTKNTFSVVATCWPARLAVESSVCKERRLTSANSVGINVRHCQAKTWRVVAGECRLSGVGRGGYVVCRLCTFRLTAVCTFCYGVGSSEDKTRQTAGWVRNSGNIVGMIELVFTIYTPVLWRGDLMLVFRELIECTRH